jgi:DeoR family glycerol-3-phosphate regulon repressor
MGQNSGKGTAMPKDKKSRPNHREIELLDALRRVGGSARNANLAEVMGVSEETIRRTAKSLAKADLVRRVHGGIFLSNSEAEHSVFSRIGRRSAEKHKIAEAAAALIPDGACLFLDVGSTTAFVAEALQNHQKLTVITNGLTVAQALVNRNRNRVFLAGGELRHIEGGAFGHDTLAFLEQFYFDFAILSVDGIDTNGGFFLVGADEASIAKTVVQRSRHKIVVADHLKFGQSGPMVVCAPDAVDTLVTDQPLAPQFVQKFNEWGIEVIHTEKRQLM